MNTGSRILSKLTYCKLCGSKIWMQGYNIQSHITHIMKKNNVCYECAFWEELMSIRWNYHQYPHRADQ